MLPQHAAQTPKADVSRYTVQSSDVISDMRVNVLEENSATVVWYKERFLSDHEIVDHLVDNKSSDICWTIHRPKRGWYIRIRSPTFPAGVSIPIVPIPNDSPYHAEAALSFSCRTNISLSNSMIPPSLCASRSGPPRASTSWGHATTESTSSEASGSTAVHSYPPTPPPAFFVQPPSPRAVLAKLDQLPERRKERPEPRLTLTQLSEFTLTPSGASPAPAQKEESLFSRALSIFKSQQPSISYSFTLRHLPPHSPLSPPPPYNPTTPSPLGTALPSAASGTQLLTFHDHTPLLTIHSISGLLEIDRAAERTLGIQSSFWVAVALTYLDFLEDRQGYLAAASD